MSTSTSLAEAQSHAITPEKFRGLDAEIQTARREKDDANTAFARAKKAAKTGAVDLKAYSIVEKLRALDDDEQIVVARHVVQYLQWLEMPVGTQFSMIDAPKVPRPKSSAKAEHAVRQAGEAGLKAGREGDPADANPHKAGTEMHVAWSTKHTEGLAERATAARMGDTEHERPADVGAATARGQGRHGGKPSQSAKVAAAMESARAHLNGGSQPH